MAADRTIMRDSALSWMTKKVSLSNEICRRLLNTSPELVLTGEAESYIEQFCYKMYLSGYSEKERMIIEREGRNQYKNIVKMSDIGCRPMYRGSDWCKQERAVSKLRSRKEWFGKKNDAVIFVQATPGEVLQREIQKVVNSSGLRLKVVERGGKSLKGVFQRSDVMPDSRCWKDDCVVCSTKPNGLCSKEGVGYRIWCEVCDSEGTGAVMHGETGRCARVKCGEHIAALMRKKNSNLWEHCVAKHNGQMVKFGCEVTNHFKNDPLGRQLDEAKRIQEEAGELLNDKNEWVRPAGFAYFVTRM